MNADEAETAFLGWLGDRGDRPAAIVATKLPHKDNNLISLRCHYLLLNPNCLKKQQSDTERKTSHFGSISYLLKHFFWLLSSSFFLFLPRS
ncbi:hypothetical protein QUA35_17130 [Microcoleus sp. N9_B2]|uniref:hypothetical protein n=1 Tax=unclassified Microcoleus TaxID=2642155 RepID=UPI002FD75095